MICFIRNSCKLVVMSKMLSVNKLYHPSTARLKSLIGAVVLCYVLDHLVLNLWSWLEIRSQVLCDRFFCLWTESFSSPTFFPLNSLLRPSLDVFTWDLKFPADLYDWTFPLKQHFDSCLLLFNGVVLVRSSFVLLFDSRHQRLVRSVWRVVWDVILHVLLTILFKRWAWLALFKGLLHMTITAHFIIIFNFAWSTAGFVLLEILWA